MADYTDDFNRADSSTVGGLWSEQESGVWTFYISTNRLAIGGSGYAGFIFYNDAFTADQRSRIQFKTGDANWRAGPAVRMSGTVASFSGYMAWFNSVAGTVAVRKYVNQSVNATDFVVLGSTSVTLATNDIVEIRIVGATITVKKNDADILTVSDGDITTGRPGFAKPDPAASITQSFWDDWAGGDIAPPSGAHQTFRRDRLRRVILARR